MKRIKYLVKGLYYLALAWYFRLLMKSFVFFVDRLEGEDREECENWAVLCAKASLHSHWRYEDFMFAAKL